MEESRRRKGEGKWENKENNELEEKRMGRSREEGTGERSGGRKMEGEVERKTSKKTKTRN